MERQPTHVGIESAHPGRKPTQVGGELTHAGRDGVFKVQTLGNQVRTTTPQHLGKEPFSKKRETYLIEDYKIIQTS